MEENHLEEFIKLVSELEKNHDFRDYGREERLCKHCFQSMNYLIYLRQSECIKKNPPKKKRTPLVKTDKKRVAIEDDFSLQPNS